MENRIREIRKAKGMTQAQLAKLLNVTQGAVQKYETGKRGVTVSKLDAISKALGVKPWEILNIWKPVDVTERTGIMKKLLNFITAPFRWVALGIRGGLAFILRNCFNCMVVYPKKKGKKNGK